MSAIRLRRVAARLIRLTLSAGLTVLAIGLIATGCSSDGSEDVFPDTYDSYFASFFTDYNPSPNLEDLAGRSTVVVEATLVDVEDGRYAGSSETDKAVVTLNLVFETDDGERYYVQLSRPMDSSVDRLRLVLPIGARSVIYIKPNTDPLEDGWFNVREDGNEWFFTTPQGWILDHPERGIVFPLEDSETEPPFADRARGPSDTLGDWLFAEKRK